MNVTSSCEEWWCDEPETLLVLEIIIIILCLIGSTGNILTVLAICFSSLRFNINCVLIGSLSFAGILYCCLILPLEVVTFHRQNHTVPPLFCNAVGGIRYTLVGVILIHLGIIALYRYLNVVHITQYQKLSKTKPLIITIAIGWLLPLVFTMPASFQVWGGFTYVPAILACTFDRDIEQSNRIVTVSLGFIVPCIFIIFCYARIGIKAYGSSKRSKNTSLMKALRLSAMMLCIFAAYFVGTFPYFIVNIQDQSFSKPVQHIWTTFLGWTLYCINPIVYTVMDLKFAEHTNNFSCVNVKKSCKKDSFRLFMPVACHCQVIYIFSYIISKLIMKDTCMEWWCDEPETLLVLEIIVIVLSLIGCVWNIITILAICFSSLRFKTYCVFIGSLSLAGFLYCCVILPLEAVTFHKQYHSVPPLFCNAVGGVRYTLVGVIVIHLGIIALYRYLNVVHLKQYQTLSKRKPLIITIAIGWLLPLVFTMPASLQVWGGFKYVPAILACTFDREIEQSNRVLTVTLGFIVPCIFIIFCYVRIGIKAYGSSKRAKSTSLVTALRRSAMMLCIFAAYFVGTFPYFVVNIYDQSFSKPVHHVWTTFLGWTLYCVNPIVYTVMDFKFRRAYKQFFSCKCEKILEEGLHLQGKIL